MGCCNSRSAATSQLPVIKTSSQNAAVKQAPEKRAILDFHCPTCGVTKPNYPNYRHSCQGEGLVSYQIERAVICNACQHNRDGVCMALKTIAPDKPGLIEVGIVMPSVQCPLRRWPRVLHACKKCGSVRFDENGLMDCPVCHPPRKRTTAIIPKFTDAPAEPKSRFAIISVAIGQKAIDIGKITLLRMRQYAEHIGADFHLVQTNRCPQYPLANKFRVGRITERYERSLYLDADLWLRSDVGNLFETFAAGSIWMHPDETHLHPNHEIWLANESISMGEEQGVIPNKSRCYNSGVVLWDREHASIWNPPPRPIATRHVAEQWWVEHQALSYGVSDLPSEYNCQWYWKAFRELEPTAKIVHLANCPHTERLTRLQKLQREDRANFI